MKKRISKTLYEKKGNKFIPVGKDDFILPYGVGDYLVRVRKGSTAISWCKKRLDVKHARIEIALDEAADALARAITVVSEMEPTRAWTPKEVKAWESYKKIAGKDTLTFSRKSAWEMARLSVILLRERLKTYESKDRPDGCLEVYAEKSG